MMFLQGFQLHMDLYYNYYFFTMIIPEVTILLLISLVKSQILFPLPQGLPVQWVYEGMWYQCQNNSIISAQNCNPNADMFTECYKVPDQGICSNNITNNSTANQLYAMSQFSFKNQSSYALLINGKQVNNTINLNLTHTISILNFTNPNISFQLQLMHVAGDDLYLVYSNISTSNISSNCLTQDANYQCTQCAPNYVGYNGACNSPTCVNELANLTNVIISQTLNYSAGNVSLVFLTNNNTVFGDCILPIVYMFTSFDNTTLTYLLPKKYLSRPTQQSVSVNIPLADFAFMPCGQIQTSTQFVTQCYMSMVATVQGITQIEYLTLFRIYVNKMVSTQVTYDAQGVAPPAICCANIVVNVTSDAQILKVINNGTKNYIVAQQTMCDPSYQNRSIIFNNATLTSNNTSYFLKMVNSSSNPNGSIATFYLLADAAANVSDPNATIQIQSSLIVTTRRMLVQRSSNIKPTYKLSTLVKLYTSNGIKTIPVTTQISNGTKNATQNSTIINNGTKNATKNGTKNATTSSNITTAVNLTAGSISSMNAPNFYQNFTGLWVILGLVVFFFFVFCCVQFYQDYKATQNASTQKKTNNEPQGEKIQVNM